MAVSRIGDAFRVLLGTAEVVLAEDIRFAEQFINREEKKVETMIADALNALAAAKDVVLAKVSNDAAALVQAKSDLAQAQSDRDAAKGQLADAENQINAVAAQLNPPQ